MKNNLFEEFSAVSKEGWILQAVQDLKGKDFDQILTSKTLEGIKIQPFYTAEDKLSSNWLNEYRHRVNPSAEVPGLPPRIWSNVFPVQAGEEKVQNKEVLDALMNGSDGLLLTLSGEEDLGLLLKEVMPQYIRIFVKATGDPVKLVQKLADWVKANGWESDALQGGLVWDGFSLMLEEKIGKQAIIETAKQLLKAAASLSQFKVFAIDGARYHNSGADSVQELTYAFGAWIDLVDALTEDGINVDDLISKTFICTGVGSDYFMEMAKIRVARILYHQLALGFGTQIMPEDIFVWAESSYWTKSKLDVYTNMLRNTSEGMAAILGGCNALCLFAHDLANGEVQGSAKRMARNISSILKEESYFDKVLDPLAGSYFIEHLIQELFAASKSSLQTLEAEGGWLKAYDSLNLQWSIKALRSKRMEALLEQKAVRVGVNKYQQKGELDHLVEEKLQEASWQLMPCRESMRVEKITIQEV